jgi:hypothetical protein
MAASQLPPGQTRSGHPGLMGIGEGPRPRAGCGPRRARRGMTPNRARGDVDDGWLIPAAIASGGGELGRRNSRRTVPGQSRHPRRPPPTTEFCWSSPAVAQSGLPNPGCPRPRSRGASPRPLADIRPQTRRRKSASSSEACGRARWTIVHVRGGRRIRRRRQRQGGSGHGVDEARDPRRHGHPQAQRCIDAGRWIRPVSRSTRKLAPPR